MPKTKLLKKDTHTKKYFEIHGKFTNLFKKFPKDKSFSAEDRQYLSVCLTELYFMSNHIYKVIKRISNTNIKNKSVNSLITNLVELQVAIDIEIVDWIRNLKKPLKALISDIEKVDHKTHNFIARKNISISMKRIQRALNKVKYYYPAKK